MKEQNHKLIITALILIMSALSVQSQTANEIIQNSRDAIKIAGQEALTTLEIYDNKGRKRVRQTTLATKMYGETEKRIIRFLSPADVKGTGMLIFDYDEKNDDMWIYMPALRKTRRIVSTEKGKNFMGSEFSNADLAAQTLEEFTYKIIGEEEVFGEACWKIEETPVDDDIADENGFSLKISWIAKSNFVMRKAVFYDLDEELWKEMQVPEIELLDKVNKKYFFKVMTMENKQNGRKSIMRMDKVQFNPNVKDEYFTTDYLER